MIPRDKLKSDPSSIFDNPGDVVDNMELSTEQKIFVLEQWRDDVMQRLVADEENMQGQAENSVRLKQITDALIDLGGT